MKRLLKTKYLKMTFIAFCTISSLVIARKSLGLPMHRASNLLGRTLCHVLDNDSV